MENKVSIRSIRNANDKMSSSVSNVKSRNTVSLSSTKANVTYKSIKTR